MHDLVGETGLYSVNAMFNKFTTIKLLFTSILIFLFKLAINQPVTGIPLWVISPLSDSGAFTVDWRTDPPAVNALVGPSLRASANAAVNRCGEPLFYIIHSGITNTPQNLFIYDLNGNPLLNNSTGNGPGLNAKVWGLHYQVVQVPGSFDEWFIIYPEFMPNTGAPFNDGTYLPARTMYSRIRYRCGNISVIERDVPLTVSGVSYLYTNGKAISHLPDNPLQLCLYAFRRNLSFDYLSLDRFLIQNNGIFFEKNTGNIYDEPWNLTIDGSCIEVTNDGQWVAINNRDQATDGSNFFIFNASEFNNDPQNYLVISVDELILQPDNQVLFTELPVEQAALFNFSLRFLQNISSKIYNIEFSPNGEYLYFTGGGFAGGGLTNTTYLGQIELGPLNNPDPYPFKLRLQIQKPPGPFDPVTGAGGPAADYPDTYYQLVMVGKCYDNAMYFNKLNTPHLFVVPHPDQPMPVNLIPSDINLEEPEHPNLVVQGSVWYLPDQIDGFNYGISNNPIIDLGTDTTLCAGPLAITPGPDFESYCWQDGSADPVFYANETGTYWVQVTDEFGCIAYDTINVTYGSLTIDLGSDIAFCRGDSAVISPGPDFQQYLWSDGSAGPSLTVKSAGDYWVEVTQSDDCIARDTITVEIFPNPIVDLGQDSTICTGTTIELDAGSGFTQYLWQNESAERYFTTSDSGSYWVEVYNPAGCKSRDTITIRLFPRPEIDLGEDTLFVNDDSFVLDAGPGFPGYLWQDGSTGQYHDVDGNGLYWVEVNDGKCTAADSVLVILSDCESTLFVPNCFTPNGDGYNDIFMVSAQNISGFSLLIFNRWGNKLYETSNLDEGWNGRYKGNICPIGTYFYLIKFTTSCLSGIIKTEERKGSVTLLE